MRLIPEQVVGLRRAILEKRRSLDGYKDYLEDNRTTSIDDINRLRIGDSFTETGFSLDRSDYNRYTDILENAEIVDSPCLDYVDVGTKFIVVYDGEDEETTLTLVETAQFINSFNGFVSVDSPLGNAAKGHKDGDHCSFKVGDRRIGFTIKAIDRNMDNYLRTINSVQKGDRRCRAALKEVKEATISKDVEKQEELRALTHSQTVLLKSEYERLKRESLRNKNNSVIARMSNIKRLLETRKVVGPNPDSDTIGVGSIFSVKLTSSKGELNFENVELVNCAVSDEYSFEYMERIGAIGYAVYGLSEGDSFKVRIGNVYYTGVVYNINNSYGSLFERGIRK